MMQKLYTFILLLFIGGTVTAQVEIFDGDLEGGQTYNWSPDQGEYLINGLVYLEAGGVLNIAPGTVIKAVEEPTTGDNTSALIITRGAQINAVGTSRAPIIFTSEQDDINDPTDLTVDERGLWGGLVILGNAPITADACEKNIEGIDSGEPRGAYGNCDNPNPEDNSGILRFISIRHGGFEIGAGNELNGLTLGGVGSGTDVSFIEVFANDDDGIEWFGGTVNVKNAVVAFPTDDGMDYDQGWTGAGQFWFVITEGDNGGEHDGVGGDDSFTPVSDPTIYNATYMAMDADEGLFFADASAGEYYNSIFTGFNNGIFLEETGDSFDAESQFVDGNLVLSNNIWWNNGSNTPADFITPNTAAVLDVFTPTNDITDPNFASVSFEANNSLDPRPAFGGAAYENIAPVPVDETDPDMPNLPFYTPTNFRGAFGGGLWIRGWTALDEYGYLPTQPEIVIRDEDLQGGETYNWTNDNTYLLDGFVYLEEGGKLNIAPGTVIKATEVASTGDNASALIISRGARICADGNANQPIIFTAQSDDVNDPTDLGPEDNGFWGGLIILGRANVTADATCKQIEGIPSGEPRALYGDCDGNFNNEDNSGFLRYVSIRHGGAQLAPGNEINGLTLGGVGSGTEISFVEVMANFDDGIEWFGGTVAVRGAVVSHCGDDAMDWDQGWSGKGQYWAVFVDESGDNGGEHDGAGDDDSNDPESDPQIHNVTYIGSWDVSRALRLRDGTSGRYANSIFSRFSTGAEIEDTGDDFDSESNFLNGDLELLNNIWWDFADGNSPADFIEPNTTAVLDAFQAAGNIAEDPQFNNIPAGSEGNLTGGLDPRTNLDGPAGDLDAFAALIANDDFYFEANHKGAFCSAGLWLSGWTAVAEYGIVDQSIPYVAHDDVACQVVGTEDLVISNKGYSLAQNTPNPANNETQIAFELPKTTNVSLVIYDMTGKTVATLLNNARLNQGINIVDFNVSNLEGGVYYYSLTNEEVTISKRLLVN